MNAKDIRSTFLEFFKSKGHHIVPSAPIVLKNDPTLLFTNAGMNQFKDLFLGNKPIEHSRIADTQKCLRVSGKHNDLEEVGLDTYHHTMFEMLGNWSFGDYFKNEAIEWAWELLTDRYRIDKNRLYVTYFEGDSSEQLEADSEAHNLWRKFLPEDKILPGSKKDNFWEMGDTGPCGPCSEIHVDLRDEHAIAKIPGGELVNKSHPLVIEIWNLVFIQFSRKSDGSLEQLPNKHVDTGMGFERLCMVLQGKKSNYDTDVFTPFVYRLEELSGHLYGKNEKTDVAMRVIADHIRAVGIAIADGQLPSNTGAGYVIRRILRRAIRYGYSFLDFKQPFIHQLVVELNETLGDTFPEIARQTNFIADVIREEELSFLRTLETGLSRLHEISGQIKNNVLPGDKVFELYDTYGFPADLTRLIANEQGLKVDEKGFEDKLYEQKERSKAASKISAGDWTVIHEGSLTTFVGYDVLTAPTQVLKCRKVNSKNKDIYQIVLNHTPFYAESGGQVGDEGWLISSKEKIKVVNTIKENDLIIHIAEHAPQHPQERFEAQVNVQHRTLTANNHSATHLLHAALRIILGSHVEQRGSLVTPEYLRFDFSHHSKLTVEELNQIEHLVNKKIRENIPLDEKQNVPFEDAIKLGAVALFGEKYGSHVRIITFDPAYSVELCGGTHVQACGQIGYFKIVAENSVAAGVRRIEAITAEKAEQFINKELGLLNGLRQLLKNFNDPLRSAETLIRENEELKKQLEQFKAARAREAIEQLIGSVTHENGIAFLSARLNLDADSIKNIAFELKREIPALFAVLATEQNGKALLTVMLGDELVQKGLNAKTIINQIAKEIHGSGGGQDFYATAGGKNPAGIAYALQKAREFIPS